VVKVKAALDASPSQGVSRIHTFSSEKLNTLCEEVSVFYSKTTHNGTSRSSHFDPSKTTSEGGRAGSRKDTHAKRGRVVKTKGARPAGVLLLHPRLASLLTCTLGIFTTRSGGVASAVGAEISEVNQLHFMNQLCGGDISRTQQGLTKAFQFQTSTGATST
jgi:hypothetical protein